MFQIAFENSNQKNLKGLLLDKYVDFLEEILKIYSSYQNTKKEFQKSN